MGKKRKKMGENARRDGWHFKSPDKFARLNKSNGAHPRVENRREEKEIYEERSKKDGRRTTGRSGRKGDNPPILPLALTFGIVASLLRAFLEEASAAPRERIRIYRDLPRRSLVNLYSFLYPRYKKNRATTHVDVDLPFPHAVHCER